MTVPDTRRVLLPAPGEPPLAMWPAATEAVGEFQLSVRRVPGGTGEPAVFVHGLGGSATNWTDLGWLLSDALDGAAIDLPGFGRSDPPRDYRLDTHVRAVTEFIEHDARGPVHLFGNSLGGAVATRVAAERPDLVKTLTLVSPALPVWVPRRGTDPRVAVPAIPLLGALAQRHLGRMSTDARARGIIELVFADPSTVPPQRWQETADEIGRRRQLPWYDEALIRSLRGLIATYLGRGRRALWRQAREISCPVLVIWGARDRLVSVSLARKASRLFREARVVVLPQCAHVSQMEDPQRVADEVRQLLAAAVGDAE
ncbi:MAG: hydrolase, alpha [Frankiales bacterium]|nr:hydrolase, alpha [Frankiales bacterium]